MPFLSTLSVRRATERINIPHKRKEFLSTLSVRRATEIPLLTSVLSVISIHALREESDYPEYKVHKFDNVFLSTLSVRRATKVRKNYMADFRISIHALREESDLGYRQL